MTGLGDPLRPCSGPVLSNRIAKAAMEEQLAVREQLPWGGLSALYRRWASGGAVLLITGHVMVDGRAVAQPGDVVLETGTDLRPFGKWAEAGHAGGGQVWMQINHPGRVVQKDLADVTWAPSASPVQIGRFSGTYPVPRA